MTDQASEAGDGKMRLMFLYAKPSNELLVAYGQKEAEWLEGLQNKPDCPMFRLRRPMGKGEEPQIVYFVCLQSWMNYYDPIVLGCPQK